MATDWAAVALPWAAALALTLALAAWLTPRAWWRRPNLRALAVVAAGTLGLGSLFGALAGGHAAPAAAPPPPVQAAAAAPAAGADYRVIDELNLRDGTGTGARRLQVLAAGTRVTATGEARQDWWRVRARVDGRNVEGWASSLWLRRADERHAR
ncbi:SH3 domain-containing protein [uncultured Massilia sp.]|uniref:SH3 domain-containing protein n=1 Tax=uncultured Massilia sp. TaxID=169973 RepID=UPI0025F954B4|nr:SH3 domain-containing protein [uncultured Massilia sp.]